MPSIETRVKEIGEERGRIAEESREILDNPGGEGGKLSDDQEEKFKKLHERSEELHVSKGQLEKQAALESDLATTNGALAGDRDTDPGDNGDPDVTGDGKELEARAFTSWLRYGIDSLDTEERLVAQRQLRSVSPEQRAQAAGSDAAGGYLVPEGFFGQLEIALKTFGGMRRSRSFVFSTDTGQDLPVPTSDDTGNVGAVLSENVAAAEQDAAFKQVMLKAHMYTSKIVRVSLQLLQDSAFDIDAFLSRALGERIGRITNTHFTTGDGVDKPSGVVQDTVEAVQGATGQTVTVKVDDLMALQHGPDEAYRQDAEWMLRDATLLIIKQLKDGEGRLMWLPGLAFGQPDTILGDRFIVNNDVAAMAASAKSILYGDFSRFYIRDVRGVQMLRLVERYADLLQVGFIAFSRHDAKLIDAGQNPIQHYANAAS